MQFAKACVHVHVSLIAVLALQTIGRPVYRLRGQLNWRREGGAEGLGILMGVGCSFSVGGGLEGGWAKRIERVRR